MAVGSVYLFTVGYTPSAQGVTRPFYPIKKKYKLTSDVITPKFPESFTEVTSSTGASVAYWFPYSEELPVDSNYIIYTPGDEIGWTDDERTRRPQIVSPKPDSKRSPGYVVGNRIVFSGQVYEATRYSFYWSDTSFEQAKNPYKSDRLIKWRKISDEKLEWTQYWYHPFLKRFYVLDMTDALQDLPDPEQQLDQKWDLFTGDSKDLTLSNFTLAEIRNLTRQGFSLETSTELVDSRDRDVLASLERRLGSKNEFPDRSFGEGTGTAFNKITTISTSVGKGGAGVNSNSSLNSDIPRMFQYFQKSGGGVSLVPLEFFFDYRPNNISYTNIGSEWQEIPRTNNSSILDFKNFKLMKIAFEFVVGEKENLFSSCDEQLARLRKIASQPFPVAFDGFDKLFDEQIVYEPSNVGSGKFAILDLSISAVYRTQPGVDRDIKGGAISRATVNMTIQEIPRNNITTIKFAKLPFKSKPSTTKDKKGDDNGDRRKFTEEVANSGSIRAAEQKITLNRGNKNSGAGNSKTGTTAGR